MEVKAKRNANGGGWRQPKEKRGVLAEGEEEVSREESHDSPAPNQSPCTETMK